MLKWLGIFANIAAIAPAVVAVLAYGSYRWNIRKQRVKVEDYLWSIVIKPPTRSDSGDRSIEQLVSALRMSEEDVCRAVFGSKHIVTEILGPAGPLSIRLRVSHADAHPNDPSNEGLNSQTFEHPQIP